MRALKKVCSVREERVVSTQPAYGVELVITMPGHRNLDFRILKAFFYCLRLKMLLLRCVVTVLSIPPLLVMLLLYPEAFRIFSI